MGSFDTPSDDDPDNSPSTELPGTFARYPLHTGPLSFPLLEFTNILLSPAVPLIQNEYVESRNLAPRNCRQHRNRSMTDTINSQGYFELRQAPQQDSHSVPSLWSVFLLSPRIFPIHPSSPMFANFSTMSDGRRNRQRTTLERVDALQ